MNRLLAIALLSVTPVLAGPFDQPYSIIETDHFKSADSHMRPVFVNRVDDENSLNRRAVVAPGAHKVTIDLAARKGFPTTQQTFDLETKPCVRYYVAAELKSPTLQEWTPIVRHEDPIGECRKKFGLG